MGLRAEKKGLLQSAILKLLPPNPPVADASNSNNNKFSNNGQLTFVPYCITKHHTKWNSLGISSAYPQNKLLEC